MRTLLQARPHRFIITTTNLRVLEGLAGPTDAIELIGRPFDLGEILDRVALALADLRLGR